MKIIVAGGRDFFDENFMADKLGELNASGKLGDNPELVCGMAKGADLMAKGMFDKNNYAVHKMPAAWDNLDIEPVRIKTNQYGKKYNVLAGMVRNHAMGDFADILVAFHDGKSKGTADMIKYMKSLGKPVYVFNY